MRCPHCGHTDRLHAGRLARSVVPGSCRHDPPDDPCGCPGWRYWLAGDEWQQELQMEQDRVDRAWGRSVETLYEGDD